VIAKLAAGAARDPELASIVLLLEPARIQIDEAARALRRYRQSLDLDPRELARIDERLAAIHEVARKHRVRPEALPELRAETEARLAALAESADAAILAKRATEAEARYGVIARQLSAKREFAAHELETRVTEAMQHLAMAGGRLEIALEPLVAPAAYGQEQVEFRVASHPQTAARAARAGRFRRGALADRLGNPGRHQRGRRSADLVFDEVDAGIGGAVAATVGKLLQSLGSNRQVLCVTHLPQVATFADAHFRVTKRGDDDAVRAYVEPLGTGGRVEELARMLAGNAITAKSRAHAKELLEQHRRR
jgi:DNA repair protein RecN (Recombination protein N)